MNKHWMRIYARLLLNTSECLAVSQLRALTVHLLLYMRPGFHGIEIQDVYWKGIYHVFSRKSLSRLFLLLHIDAFGVRAVGTGN